MPIKIRTTFRGLSPPLLANERIRKRIDRLERLYPRIVSCHVVVEEAHRHHHKGKLYSVRVELTVPGGEVVVSRDRHDEHAREDFFVAMRDAFDALEIRLKSYAERQA